MTNNQTAIPNYIDKGKYSYLLLTTKVCPECKTESRHEVWQDDETKETFTECDNYQCRNISKW